MCNNLENKDFLGCQFSIDTFIILQAAMANIFLDDTSLIQRINVLRIAKLNAIDSTYLIFSIQLDGRLSALRIGEPGFRSNSRLLYGLKEKAYYIKEISNYADETFCLREN
uniref:Uncharacterized protein n=1 Tax=Onchocerca volvulus TaxID=6282 RepID=A0A8R1TQC7_ONCVO